MRPYLCAVMVLLAALCGCRSRPEPQPLQRYEFKSAHMGTLFRISLYAPSQAQAEDAADAAFHRIDQLEALMSDYRADSELNLLRQDLVGAPVPISSDLFLVLERALQVAQLTDGAFDPTIGPFVRLWRFARKRQALPSPQEVERARAAVGWRKLELDPRATTVTLGAPAMQLDLGGIAKGYAADQALAVLRQKGIRSALVAASGDIVVSEPPPGQTGWRVRIAAFPGQANELAPLILRNAAVSTSGDAEQFIEIGNVRYSHIVSPVTGLGLTERLQVSILGPNATTTDSLATAISVLGRERGLKLVESLPGVEALVFVHEPGADQVYASRGFPPVVK